jgi:hypothetical protein
MDGCAAAETSVRLVSALDAEPVEAFPESLGELISYLTRAPLHGLDTTSDEKAQKHFDGVRNRVIVTEALCQKRRVAAAP